MSVGKFINPANHTPYLIPEGTVGHEGTFKHGWFGVLGGAGTVFFAFIGFDAVSTAAQEAKNPAKRYASRGILGSLAVCTILYILFGLCPHRRRELERLRGQGQGSIRRLRHSKLHAWLWLEGDGRLDRHILAGFWSVILVMLLGQSRVFYSMANDGLLPKLFSDLHPICRTLINRTSFCFSSWEPSPFPFPNRSPETSPSIGTLFAFVLVSLGIWILRKREPNLHRPFRTPMVPLVPILGVVVCGAMIISRDRQTQLTALGWMLIGFVVYFLYSRSHSKLNTTDNASKVFRLAARVG